MLGRPKGVPDSHQPAELQPPGKAYTFKKPAKKSTVVLPKVECRICAEEKTAYSFSYGILYTLLSTGEDELATHKHTVPSYCLAHISPGPSSPHLPICIDCIRRHIMQQTLTYNPDPLPCPVPNCPVDWSSYAYNLLTSRDRDRFATERLRIFLYRNPLWKCPLGCKTAAYTADAVNTPGFPQIECPGCRTRFCFLCRAMWHRKLSCQEFTFMCKDVNASTRKVVGELAGLGVRLCPRCQQGVVKGQGCEHVQCGGCGVGFRWEAAERVGFEGQKGEVVGDVYGECELGSEKEGE